MIKTGIVLSEKISPTLFRLLVKHPDVEIVWIKRGDGTYLEQFFFETLQGEIDDIPLLSSSEEPNYTDIDLYIGPYNDAFGEYLKNSEVKAVLTDGSNGDILGVCELNRKDMVRGGRTVCMPDVATLLGALALMPLAKNLMLNSVVNGCMLLPALRLGHALFKIPSTAGDVGWLDSLRDGVLSQLQTSFNAPVEINTILSYSSSFACAVLTVDMKLAAGQARELYEAYYSDHRHVFIYDEDVTDRMVIGTNKTAIELHNDSHGRLVVTVAFDARYKASAGNIVHILNLLFGLDERTAL